MNKQEVIDYVMNTPHNVNRTILSQSLDEIGTQAEADMVLSASGAYLHEQSAENITIEYGNAQSLWEKMKKGERVAVVLRNWFVYGDETVTYEEVNFDFVEIYAGNGVDGDGINVKCSGVVTGYVPGNLAARGVSVVIQNDTVLSLSFSEIKRDNLD